MKLPTLISIDTLRQCESATILKFWTYISCIYHAEIYMINLTCSLNTSSQFGIAHACGELPNVQPHGANNHRTLEKLTKTNSLSVPANKPNMRVYHVILHAFIYHACLTTTSFLCPEH